MVWQNDVDVLVEWGARGEDSANDAAWDVTEWDDADRYWAGTDPEWLLVDDCLLQALTTKRGRTVAVEGFTVGTANIGLVFVGGDEPGEHWSWRSAVTIGDELRVRAVVKATGVVYPIYRGDIRSLSDGWTPDGYHTVTMSLTDIKGRLGRVDLPEREPTGGGDRTGERMHRIADLAEIPATRRRFDPGLMVLQPSTFAQNLAGETDVTMASEGGDVFAGREGKLWFRQRAWWQTDFRASNVRAIWANTTPPDNPTAAPVACPDTIDTRLALDLINNQVSLARAGGSEQTVRDSASRSLYGLATYSRNDLLNDNDNDVRSLAQWRLAETSTRTRIIDGIQITPVGDLDAWRGVLDAELGDLHRLVWDDGDVVTDLPVHVQGIDHSVTSETWHTKLAVWDRFMFTPSSGWDIDVWDTAEWAAA